MYRIELAPGEETVFRTIEELAVAVRNGLVTPRCRIYHNATQKWLPIEFHPHYKKALSLPAARVAEAAAPRTSGHPPPLDTLSFAVAPAARPAPVAEPVAEPTPELTAETRAGAGHPGTDPLDARYSGAELPATTQPVTKRAVTKHRLTEHPVTKPAVADHPVTALPRHPASEHAVTPHSAVKHPAAQPSPPIEHSVAESSYPAHPAVEPPAVAHRFGSHADTAAESPIRAEPAPTPKSESSSYRPDSYLPPSVRVVADDPHVAIAPEPAAAPPIFAAPRRSWSMMPAVQETPELPTISYPEFTPAVEPVAERPSSSRGHRPLQVAVAVLVLAAGGYLARSFYSPVRGSDARGDASAPAATVVDRPALPKGTSAPVPTAVTTKPSPRRPAVITPTAPASSGFAAALEPRAIASGPAPILPARAVAASLPPAVSAADSAAVAASIAPPPGEMQIDVPALPGGDSLVAQPSSRSDSAMKRILRAVNGGQNPK